MAQFEFNDENKLPRNSQKNRQVRGLSGRLIAWGLAKNETQANTILVGISLISMVLIVINIIRILN